MTGRAARRLVPNSSSLRRGFGWADSVAMSVSEKTYTFRAPSDLGSRAHQAVETLASLLDEEPNEERDEAMAAFLLVFLRRAREFRGSQNQSALFRATLEGFIEAAEKLAGTASTCARTRSGPLRTGKAAPCVRLLRRRPWLAGTSELQPRGRLVFRVARDRRRSRP